MILLLLQAATAPSDTTSTQILIAALGAGGFGAIVAAIIAGLFSKKKLGSEATEIITRAASGVVTSIEAELARAKETHKAERDQWQADRTKILADHAAELDDVRRVLQLHVAWDALAIAKMADFGVTLPPAPPLLPPRLNS